MRPKNNFKLKKKNKTKTIFAQEHLANNIGKFFAEIIY